jgi:putative Holliday junction resolvase
LRVIGLDLGSKRVGVAVGDTDTRVATPVSVLPRTADLVADRRKVAELVAEWEAGCVVVGLPISLDGSMGPAARAAETEIAALAAALAVPVIAHDERLSTVSAHHALAEAGQSSRDRRERVDAVAASVFLQDWLDRHAPAAPVEPGADPS